MFLACKNRLFNEIIKIYVHVHILQLYFAKIKEYTNLVLRDGKSFRAYTVFKKI